MRAIEVYYQDRYARNRYKTILGGQNVNIEDPLVADDDADYTIGNPYCKILELAEIPLEKVQVKDLNVAELIQVIQHAVTGVAKS